MTKLSKSVTKLWQNAFKVWSNVMIADKIFDSRMIMEQCLWYNSCIRKGNNVANDMKLYTSGITQVRNIMVDDRLLSFEELIFKYGNMCDFLKYAQILSAITKLWKTNLNNILEYDLTDKFYQLLSCHKNFDRNLYDLVLPKYCLLPIHKLVESEIEIDKSNIN